MIRQFAKFSLSPKLVVIRYIPLRPAHVSSICICYPHEPCIVDVFLFPVVSYVYCLYVYCVVGFYSSGKEEQLGSITRG